MPWAEPFGWFRVRRSGIVVASELWLWMMWNRNWTRWKNVCQLHEDGISEPGLILPSEILMMNHIQTITADHAMWKRILITSKPYTSITVVSVGRIPSLMPLHWTSPSHHVFHSSVIAVPLQEEWCLSASSVEIQFLSPDSDFPNSKKIRMRSRRWRGDDDDSKILQVYAHFSVQIVLVSGDWFDFCSFPWQPTVMQVNNQIRGGQARPGPSNTRHSKKIRKNFLFELIDRRITLTMHVWKIWRILYSTRSLQASCFWRLSTSTVCTSRSRV